MSDSTVMLRAEGLDKTFTLHLRGGLLLPVLRDVSFTARAGECLGLVGPSGAGKSTLLRCLFGNYAPDAGRVLVRHDGAMIDLVRATPRQIVAVRERTIGYVSQFLRVVPRVPALDVVAEPLVMRGVDQSVARARAAALLNRLDIPARMHALPPATFSGGEQQRINLARGFIADHPVLLLDEPTASLDAERAAVVVAMIREACARGVAAIGIFHDRAVRDQVCTATIPLVAHQEAAAA